MDSSPPLEPRTGAVPGAGDLSALAGGGLELLTALLGAIPARVVVLDAAEQLVYANHEFFAFTGLHPKQVLGQTIARIIGAEAYEAYRPVHEQLKRGQTVSWEGWVPLAARGRRYMREHLIPVGPPLIWGGAALWLFNQGSTGWGIFMLVWGMFLISGVDNVVKPMLISRGSSLPFLLVLLGVMGGVLAFGFVGLFIGPTLLAVAMGLLRNWTHSPDEGPAVSD